MFSTRTRTDPNRRMIHWRQEGQADPRRLHGVKTLPTSSLITGPATPTTCSATNSSPRALPTNRSGPTCPATTRKRSDVTVKQNLQDSRLRLLFPWGIETYRSMPLRDQLDLPPAQSLYILCELAPRRSLRRLACPLRRRLLRIRLTWPLLRWVGLLRPLLVLEVVVGLAMAHKPHDERNDSNKH